MIEKYEDLFGADEVLYMGEYEIELFFEKVQTSESGEEKLFDELISFLTSDNTADNNLRCLKLMKLIDLGTIEKGLISFDTKVQSFHQQWFRDQKKK